MPPSADNDRGVAGRAIAMWTRALGILSLIATLPPPSGAQGLLQLNAGSGELGFELRHDRRGYSTGPGTRDRSYREWLRIPFHGALPNRQVFSYTLVFRPLVGQQDASGLPRALRTRANGLDVNVAVLQSSRGGLHVFATQQEGSAEGGLGGESDYATRGRGATLRLASPLLPFTLDWSERRTRDAWQGAFSTAPFERSERVRTTRFHAGSSKTSVLAERLTLEDHRGSTSFDAVTAAANHRLQWGKGSILESSLEASAREGYDPHRRRQWAERLQLRHTRALTTQWTLQRRVSTTFGAPSSGASFGAGLRTEATRWLSAAVQADRSSSQFVSGRSRSTSLVPRVTIRRAAGTNTWVHAALATGFETIRRDLTSGDYAETSEERHRVGPDRSLQLSRINVDANSVIVRSADQTVTYRAREDYRLIALGPVVRLQFPVGSRIASGDVVVVAYRFLLLLRTPYRIYSATADASISSPRFHMRQSLSSRSVDALDSARRAVPEQGIEDVTTLGGTTRVLGGTLELEIERRRRARSVANYGVREARLLFVPAPGTRWSSSVGANVAQTIAAGQRIGVASGNAVISFSATAGLRLQSSIDAWYWRLSNAPRERFTGMSAQVNWKLGQLDTEWRYWYQLREQVLRGVEHRLWARVVRRF